MDTFYLTEIFAPAIERLSKTNHFCWQSVSLEDHMKLPNVSTDAIWNYFIIFDEFFHCLHAPFLPAIIPMMDL